jgi:hypothetical protein
VIFAAAPVALLTEPVIFTRVSYGALHFPRPLAPAYFTIATVVPFPPFHVIVSVTVPAVCPDLTAVIDEPPAARAAGVHVASVDLSFPPVCASGADVSFAHETLGVSAAPAGVAN